MRRSRKAPAYGVGRPRRTPAWMSSSSSVMLLSPVMVPPEAVVDRAASRVPLPSIEAGGDEFPMNFHYPALLFLPLFTQVRGRLILRSSHTWSSKKFAPGVSGWHHY